MGHVALPLYQSIDHHLAPFLLQETVRRNFASRLRVTVLRAKELPKEAAMADYVLSGSAPDAFVLLEVKSKWGYDQGRTATVMDSYAPEWTGKKSFFLQ